MRLDSSDILTSHLEVFFISNILIVQIKDFHVIIKIQQFNILELAMNFVNPLSHMYKQQVLHILQSYQNVPKDDRLIIRKYITNLKDLNSNTLVKLILSKGKEHDDRKVQILLRKQANFLRKKQQATLLTKRNSKQQNIQNLKPPNSKPDKIVLKIQTLAHSREKQLKSLNSSAKKISIVSPKASPRLNTVQSARFTNMDKSQSKNKRSIKGLNEITNLIRERQNYEMPTEFTEQSICDHGKNIKKIQNQKINKHNHTRSRSWDQFCSAPALSNGVKTITMQNQNFLMQCKNMINGNQRPLTTQNTPTKQLSFVQSYQSVKISSAGVSILNSEFHKQFKSLQLIGEQFFDFLIPQFLRFKSPSSFSMPYHQLLSKIASFLITIKKQKSNAQEMAKKILETNSMCRFLFFPFTSEYDIVTVDSLSEFLKEYFEPKLVQNPVRNLFMRINIGIQASNQFKFKCPQKISVFQFKQAYQWKSGDVGNLFEKLVQQCNVLSMNLSYWEFYWLKDRQQFALFYDSFYKN